MNENVRSEAVAKNLCLMNYILKINKEKFEKTGLNRTIFAVCPNSAAVTKSALNSTKRCSVPIKSAAILNQVDFYKFNLVHLNGLLMDNNLHKS